MRRWKLIAGLALVGAAAALAFLFAPGGGPSVRTVKIWYGSEKKGLLSDPQFAEILRERYGIQVEGIKMGSLEMAKQPLQAVDGLWPSSELAAQVFRDRHPDIRPRSHNIFNTPIVFYSWPDITEALIAEGIVEKRDNVYYVIDTQQYLEMMVARRQWKSLGLPKQNGGVTIRSTDPTKSNSGFLVSGLMAIILNDGNMVEPESLQGPSSLVRQSEGAESAENQAPQTRTLLSVVRDIYDRMGYLESSTGILFDKYIKQGQGAFPLISAYENLIIEFYQRYPDFQQTIRERVRTLIPEPTVWSEHPFIALNENGQKLLKALQDPQVQALAWKQYGFRSGVMGISNDPEILKEVGLPQRIESVAPLPAPPVMEAIMAALK